MPTKKGRKKGNRPLETNKGIVRKVLILPQNHKLILQKIKKNKKKKYL